MRTRELDARREVEAWEQGLRERELVEKRRRAPGWLDSEQHLLKPEKAGESSQVHSTSGRETQTNLMDDEEVPVHVQGRQTAGREELGDAMDRAFGRSEMG